MALLPVKFLWPIRLDPGGSEAFTVEDQIRTVKAIFDPMLRLYNTSAGSVHLNIQHTLDLGYGDDPLYSGSWTFDVVDDDIPTLALRDYEFTPQIDLDTVAITRHTVTTTNLSSTEERIVRFILFGKAEVVTQLPAGQQIIRSVPL